MRHRMAEARGGAQQGVEQERDDRRSERARPAAMTACAEFQHRRQRRLSAPHRLHRNGKEALATASPPTSHRLGPLAAAHLLRRNVKDAPAVVPLRPLQRGAHLAPCSSGTTAKAICVTCACERRSITWMTRLCGTSPSAWMTARRSGCCASSSAARALIDSSLAVGLPSMKALPSLVSEIEKTTCTASPEAALGRVSGTAVEGAITSFAVTMKMISSTNVMSTSGVTLMPPDRKS